MRPAVVQQGAGLDPMQPELGEGDPHHGGDGGRRDAAAVVRLVDPVAEVGGAEGTQDHVVEVDPADRLVADRDHPRPVDALLVPPQRLGQQGPLPVRGEVRVLADRVPRREEVPVARQHVGKRVGVVSETTRMPTVMDADRSVGSVNGNTLSIDVPGGRLAAERWAGSGPTLVLLHAGVVDRRAWGDATGSPDAYAVVAYDRRGFGESPPSQESFTHVEDLRAVLDAVGADRVAGRQLAGGEGRPRRSAGIPRAGGRTGAAGAGDQRRTRVEADPETERLDALIEAADAAGRPRRGEPPGGLALAGRAGRARGPGQRSRPRAVPGHERDRPAVAGRAPRRRR